MKKELGKIYRNYRDKYKKYRFEKIVASNPKELRIVIGSSGVFDKKWIPTEEFFLNLLQPKDWIKYFKTSSIDMMLAEHVWEHLTPEQGKIAAKTCFDFLKKGAHLRIAVPDGFNPDEVYIDFVKPGGKGWGSDDHKVLYNYKTFSDLFSSVGFEIKLLEYFDENGNFIFNDWKREEGYIKRSKRFDKRNKNGKLGYTSIIIDAVKPY